MKSPNLEPHKVKEYDRPRDGNMKNRIIIAPGHYGKAIDAILKAGYSYHHKCVSSLNFSEQYAAVVEPYSGRFGIGFKVHTHVSDYANRSYYRQHKTICYYFIAGEHNNAKEN